jgi:hypothetical protein
MRALVACCTLARHREFGLQRIRHGFRRYLGFSGAAVDAFGDGANDRMIDGVDAGFDVTAVDAAGADATGVGATGLDSAGFCAADFEVTGADATGSVERGITVAAG